MIKRFSQFAMVIILGLAMLLGQSCLFESQAIGAEGDFSIFRNSSAVAIGTTTAWLPWDTTVSAATNIAIQTGNVDIDLADGGHYLIMYSVPTESSGGTNRSEIQTWIRNETTTTNLQYGRGQGFIRRTAGADEAYNQGAAIIDVTAGDDIRIQSIRTDSNTGTAQTRANKAGISILKLKESWDYIRTRPSSDQTFSSTSFIDLTLATDDEIDSGTFSRSGSTITLAITGHYLITYNVSFSQNDETNRGNLETRLTLDGTEINGTRVTAYQRGTNSTEDSVAAWAGIIETSTPNQELVVQIRRESANTITGLTTTAAETGITIAKLLDTASYVRLNEAGGGQDLSASRTDITWDEEDEVDSIAFGHTTANSERVEIDLDGDYLFFSSLYASRSSGTVREAIFGEWQNSNTSASGTDGSGVYYYGGFGQYNRGSQSAGDAYTSGASTGAILEGLQDTEYITLTQINETANSVSTYEADRMGLQGVELASLFASDPVTDQLHYRWRDDTTDLNTSGGFLAAEDTIYTEAIANTTYRLRVEVANTGDSPESAARTYELQWGELTTTCADISTWTGVANTSDEFDMVTTTHIDPDGESTTSGLLANSASYTFVNGQGRESADTTGSIGALAASNYTELEYSLEPTSNATLGQTYCFRVYDTTAGDILDLYSTYAQMTMATPNTKQLHFRWRDDTTDLNTSGGFLAVEDSNAIGNINKNTTYRLRLEIANTGNIAESAARTYELEWGEKTTTCSDISTWTGMSDATDEFTMMTTTHIDPDGE